MPMSLWGGCGILIQTTTANVPVRPASVPGTQWLPKECLFPSMSKVIQRRDCLRVQLWLMAMVELEVGPAACLRSNMALGIVGSWEGHQAAMCQEE